MGRPKFPEALNNYGFRLPIQLVARVDAFADKEASGLPGYRVSRSDAVRVLLERSLTEAGFPHTGETPKSAEPVKRTKAKRSK